MKSFRRKIFINNKYVKVFHYKNIAQIFISTTQKNTNTIQKNGFNQKGFSGHAEYFLHFV